MTMRHLQSCVLENRELSGDLSLLRLHVPGLGDAQPGQFIHLTCGGDLTLPRPFSILDIQPVEQTVDLLYRVVGEGTRRMRGWQRGQEAPLLGPIGRPFTRPPVGSKAVLVAGGVGVAPLDFFARRLVAQGVEVVLLWGIESESPWPLVADPARGGVPEGLAVAHLQQAGVVSRLASLTERPGYFCGYVTELVTEYLQASPSAERGRLQLYTCGPLPMMGALAQVAERLAIGGEASLEAQMACGFGVCMGCALLIQDGGAGYYRRVCVDGPVFSLAEVDWRQAGG
ncbi:MAG: dihydroorotate dehydrogenase electron transfer subunit [Magnetococcus sp. YQC-3]